MANASGWPKPLDAQDDLEEPPTVNTAAVFTDHVNMASYSVAFPCRPPTQASIHSVGSSRVSSPAGLSDPSSDAEGALENQAGHVVATKPLLSLWLDWLGLVGQSARAACRPVVLAIEPGYLWCRLFWFGAEGCPARFRTSHWNRLLSWIPLTVACLAAAYLLFLLAGSVLGTLRDPFAPIRHGTDIASVTHVDHTRSMDEWTQLDDQVQDPNNNPGNPNNPTNPEDPEDPEVLNNRADMMAMLADMELGMRSYMASYPQEPCKLQVRKVRMPPGQHLPGMPRESVTNGQVPILLLAMREQTKDVTNNPAESGSRSNGQDPVTIAWSPHLHNSTFDAAHFWSEQFWTSSTRKLVDRAATAVCPQLAATTGQHAVQMSLLDKVVLNYQDAYETAQPTQVHSAAITKPMAHCLLEEFVRTNHRHRLLTADHLAVLGVEC